MAGLFIQLDVEYASDDEIIDAGPMAELLFVRGLCFIKRKALDGHIKANQLASVAGNIPSAAKHAQSLVRTGLWQTTKDGWYCPSYLKRNPSKAALEDQKQAAREFGVQGNHDRWHVGPEGKPSAKCPLCRASRIGSASGTPIRNGSPYTDPDPETESYPDSDPETYPDPTAAAAQTTHVGGELDDAGAAAFERTIDLAVEIRRDEDRPTKPKPWAAAVKAGITAEDGERLRALLNEGHDPVFAAGLLLGNHVSARQAARRLGIPIPGEEAAS